MHRSRFISDIPTNAIVPRDTIIQLPKSYLEGYFLKCLAARKRRTKPSRKRRKREGRRRKKEERTYANWQLGITRKKLEQASWKIINIPPYRSPNISQQNACISTITRFFLVQKLATGRRTFVYHELSRVLGKFCHRVSGLFRRPNQDIASINKNQILNLLIIDCTSIIELNFYLRVCAHENLYLYLLNLCICIMHELGTATWHNDPHPYNA